MAEVSAAAAAKNFHAFHAVAMVGAQFDFVLVSRLPEAWPAAAGIEFSIRSKQFLAAGGTVVGAVCFVVHVLAGKWRFGPFLSQDLVLGRC